MGIEGWPKILRPATAGRDGYQRRVEDEKTLFHKCGRGILPVLEMTKTWARRPCHLNASNMGETPMPLCGDYV